MRTVQGTKSNSRTVVALSVVLICALVYVASLGPARWATRHGYMSETAYLGIYAPLHWIGKHAAPLKWVGDHYLDFWQ